MSIIIERSNGHGVLFLAAFASAARSHTRAPCPAKCKPFYGTMSRFGTACT